MRCPRCAAPLALRQESAAGPLDRDLALDRRGGARDAGPGGPRRIGASGDPLPKVTPRFWKLEEPAGTPKPSRAAPAPAPAPPPPQAPADPGSSGFEILGPIDAAPSAPSGPAAAAAEIDDLEAMEAALGGDTVPGRPTPPVVAPPRPRPRQGSLPFVAPARPVPAPPLRRAVAWLVDAALAGALGWLLVAGGARLAGAVGPVAALVPTAVALAALLHFVHATLGHVLSGRTLGKWMAGLAVVGPDGRRPTPGRAALRALLSLAAAAPLGLGLLPALAGRRLALHDRLAGTAVVVPP